MKKIASNIKFFLKKLLTNVKLNDIIKKMKEKIEKNIEIVHFF